MRSSKALCALLLFSVSASTATADNSMHLQKTGKTYESLAEAPHLRGKTTGVPGNRNPVREATGLGKRLNRFRMLSAAAVLFSTVSIVWNMHPGSGNNNPPSWDPAGNVSYRRWTLEIQAWLNMTASRNTPTAQAASIQLALRGTARDFALTVPYSAITAGAAINGINADPVTYLMYALANQYEQLEDERAMSSGNMILDFRAQNGERIDSLLTRFDMARAEAATVGAGMDNFSILSTILLRACGVSANQTLQLLDWNAGRMPNNQQTYDTMTTRLRSMGHILEGSPGNIMTGLSAPGQDRSRSYAIDSGTSTFLGVGALGTPFQTAPVEAQHGLFGGGAAATSTQNVQGWASAPGSWNVQMPAQNPAGIFTAYEQEQIYNNGDYIDYDSGTDSDTQSDCGEGYTYEDVQDVPPDEASQVLWTKYQHAKGRWREHERRPVRKVRRFFRKYLSSKGKGKGKRAKASALATYATNLSHDDYQEIFYGKGKSKGRGKLKGVRSSGKGAGRRKNPRGKDGQIMKCLGNNRQCGSEEHLVRDCPHETGRNSSQQASLRQNTSTNYVESVEMMLYIHVVTTDAPVKTFKKPKVGGALNKYGSEGPNKPADPPPRYMEEPHHLLTTRTLEFIGYQTQLGDAQLLTVLGCRILPIEGQEFEWLSNEASSQKAMASAAMAGETIKEVITNQLDAIEEVNRLCDICQTRAQPLPQTASTTLQIMTMVLPLVKCSYYKCSKQAHVSCCKFTYLGYQCKKHYADDEPYYYMGGRPAPSTVTRAIATLAQAIECPLPTYTYECDVCGNVYDPVKDGGGMAFEDLPDAPMCPQRCRWRDWGGRSWGGRFTGVRTNGQEPWPPVKHHAPKMLANCSGNASSHDTGDSASIDDRSRKSSSSKWMSAVPKICLDATTTPAWTAWEYHGRTTHRIFSHEGLDRPVPGFYEPWKRAFEGAYDLFHSQMPSCSEFTNLNRYMDKLENAARIAYFHNIHTYHDHISKHAQIRNSEIKKVMFAMANHDLRILYSARPGGPHEPPVLIPAPGDVGDIDELYHDFLRRITCAGKG